MRNKVRVVLRSGTILCARNHARVYYVGSLGKINEKSCSVVTEVSDGA